jgi:hypothetical protein
VIGVNTRTMTHLAMLLSLMVILGACGSAQSESPRTDPAPGELDALRVEVHEAPG